MVQNIMLLFFNVNLFQFRYDGLSQDCPKQVFCSTVLAKLLYASQAWSEFFSAVDVNKLNNFSQQMQKNYITANKLILASPNSLNLLTSL